MTPPTWHNGEYKLESPEGDGGPDMRMTAAGAEDLNRMITRARPDWSGTATWRVVGSLKKDFTNYSFTEIVIAAMAVAHNPLVPSPDAILATGKHWENVRPYLAGTAQGRGYTDVHSAQILEQARADAAYRENVHRNGPSPGYLAATAALAEATQRRAEARAQ